MSSDSKMVGLLRGDFGEDKATMRGGVESVGSSISSPLYVGILTSSGSGWDGLT